jgi:hypothetical protein
MVGRWIQDPVHRVNWAYLNSLVPSSCATCGESGHILIFLKFFRCSRKNTVICVYPLFIKFQIIRKIKLYKLHEVW